MSVLDDALCSSNKPEDSRACSDLERCTFSYGEWSPLSACVNSQATRTRVCIRQDGVEFECSRCGGVCSEIQTCTPPPPPATYSWTAGAWGACSNVCGMGTQSRTVTCVSSTGQEVANSFCAGSPMPETQLACSNYQGCTYAYSAWSAFSGCTGGQQSRTRTCARQDGLQVACSFCGDQCSESTSCSASPSAIIEFNDPASRLVSYHSQIETNLIRAFRDYADIFNSSATVQIVVKVEDTAVGRLGGRSVTNTIIGTWNGRSILEEGAVHKLRTGTDLNGSAPDVEILIDPDYFANEMWLDPNPATRTTAVPANRMDGVSLFLHELGHAFGFNGFRNISTGELPNGYVGSFDRFVLRDGSGRNWFTGENARSVYGGDLPLTWTSPTQNIYHYGDPSTAITDGLGRALMTGNYYTYGFRYSIGDIDRAVLRDLNLPLR